jgi:hypothetical protein
MDIEKINSAIMFGSFTNNELSSIIDAVKYAKSRLQKTTIRSLMIGDTVNFTSSKTGRTVTGTVMKVAIKYVTVKTIDGLWRVPANMIEKIEDESDPMDDFNYVGSRHHY